MSRPGKDPLEVLRDFHRAFEGSDFATMFALLAPDVVWRAAPGQSDVCADRQEVLDRLRELAGQVPPLDTLEMLEVDDEILVGLPVHEPWDHADVYQRVRIQGGVITAIQDYESREDALTR